MYANVPPNMMAGANVPPTMVAGAMDTMPHYGAPVAYGYGCGVPAAPTHGSGFLLILVLFILLVIIGTSYAV